MNCLIHFVLPITSCLAPPISANPTHFFSLLAVHTLHGLPTQPTTYHDERWPMLVMEVAGKAQVWVTPSHE